MHRNTLLSKIWVLFIWLKHLYVFLEFYFRAKEVILWAVICIAGVVEVYNISFILSFVCSHIISNSPFSRERKSAVFWFSFRFHSYKPETDPSFILCAIDTCFHLVANSKVATITTPSIPSQTLFVSNWVFLFSASMLWCLPVILSLIHLKLSLLHPLYVLNILLQTFTTSFLHSDLGLIQ